MLTKGNGKIGREVWSFSLPSGPEWSCPGATPETCVKACYDRRLVKFRPAVQAHREVNFRLSKRRDFATLLHSAIVAAGARLVRAHVGGDFWGARYAKDWLRVMTRLPGARFWLYSRSWRVEAIRPVLEAMSELANVRVWYSLDRETGLPPESTPLAVRYAWMMTSHEDLPPPEADLVFRTWRLRKVERTRVEGTRTCAAEDGVVRGRKVTCESCDVCHRPQGALPERGGLLALPMLTGVKP